MHGLLRYVTRWSREHALSSSSKQSTVLEVDLGMGPQVETWALHGHGCHCGHKFGAQLYTYVLSVTVTAEQFGVSAQSATHLSTVICVACAKRSSQPLWVLSTSGVADDHGPSIIIRQELTLDLPDLPSQ